MADDDTRASNPALMEALSAIVRVAHAPGNLEQRFFAFADALTEVISHSALTLLVRRPNASYGVLTVERDAEGPWSAVQAGVPIRAQHAAALETSLRRSSPLYSEDAAPLAGSGLHDDRPHTLVPIRSHGRTCGALCVVGDRLDDELHRLFEDVAPHLALAIRTHERDEQSVDTDSDQEASLRTLGEMGAGVAHDFNNLLSAILGRAQMLKAALDDSELLRSVSVIEKAALDGAGTVRRIQEFAKKKADDLATIRVSALVKDTAERAKTRAMEREVTNLDVRIELGDDAAVLGSAIELRQVLTNLIYNAIDAMPEGGTLSIRSGHGGGRAWFEVEDTGVGMDEETQQKMFDPFYTTKGSRGTGLGLAVSFGVVQRHGGEFSVSSIPGRGSRFRVSLPTVEGHRKRASEPPRPTAARSLHPSQTCGSILLIDDDVAVRETLAEILASENHEVVSAKNGQDGVEIFGKRAFDLVLTDIGMADMNGWEVAERIKAMSPNTPVGVISGWGAHIDEQMIVEYGVDVVMSKPFRYDEVLECVARALGGGL